MATKPVLSEDEASAIFHESYGMVVDSISSLPSYDDKNFLMKTQNGKFLMKIFNSDISADQGRCEEHCKLQYLWSENGIPVPKVIHDKDGNLQAKKLLKVASGKEALCYIRILSFLEGEICQNLPANKSFYHQIGNACAKTHGVMKKHSAEFPTLNALRHDWTLESVINKEWADKISTIDSDITRNNVIAVIKEFKAFLAGNPELESGVIHCDLNSLNIIGQQVGESVVLKGIIDFGDVCHSRFIFDLGICIIYMMVAVLVQDGENANFYDAAKWVLSGYEEVQKLSKLEMDIIFMVIKVRAAQSVIGAYFTVSIEPENREYLMSEAGKAEIILNKMSLISDKTFHEKIAK